MIEPYKIICPCSYQDSHKNTKLIIQCTSCKNYQHKYCMKSMVKMSGYQCPYCQLKKGALFFNILYSLIDPTLIEFNSTNKNLSNWLNFIPDMNVYSTFTKKYNDSPIAIIIRCLRLDKDGFSFHWPKMSKIYINNKIILDLTKKGSKHKDKMITLIKGEDFDNNELKKKFFLYESNIIKTEDFLIPEKPNRLQVQVNLNEGEILEFKSFIISVDLCEILKEADSIIKSVPIIKNKNEIKKIIINNESENNILSMKEKVSLLDIYTETDKIKLPARGINCCHLNVFDLETFLIMNRKTNKFLCPYCKRNSNDLYIDGVLYDFIKDKNNENISEILLDKDYNISSEDNTVPFSDINTNSNSNDETWKTDDKKNIKRTKSNNKITKNIFKKKEKKNNHYLREPKIIHITDDESLNENENSSNKKNQNYVDENNFRNNNCNIISDLGQVFDNIRQDILNKSKSIYQKNKFKRNKSCQSSVKHDKMMKKCHIKDDSEDHWKKNNNMEGNNLFINSGENRLKLKFENPFNKMLQKKRKKINFKWSEKKCGC